MTVSNVLRQLGDFSYRFARAVYLLEHSYATIHSSSAITFCSVMLSYSGSLSRAALPLLFLPGSTPTSNTGLWSTILEYFFLKGTLMK